MISFGQSVKFPLQGVPMPPSLPRERCLPLSERLRHHYPDLSETERRAADLLIAAPAAILLHTGKEISEKAGISAASFSRLIRRLGYGGLAEAQQAERGRRTSGAPYDLFEPGRPAGGGPLERVFEPDRRLLSDSQALLDPQAFGEAVAALAAARCLWVAGFRNNRFLADYARTLFATMRPGVHALAPPGQTVAEGIAGVGPGDVVVAFGMRRRMALFRPMLEALGETGAEVLVIADRSLPPPVPGARWTLVCAVETAQAIDSYVAPIALVRRLALETLQRLGPEARDRLGRVETALGRLRELE